MNKTYGICEGWWVVCKHGKQITFEGPEDSIKLARKMKAERLAKDFEFEISVISIESSETKKWMGAINPATWEIDPIPIPCSQLYEKGVRTGWKLVMIDDVVVKNNPKLAFRLWNIGAACDLRFESEQKQKVAQTNLFIM